MDNDKEYVHLLIILKSVIMRHRDADKLVAIGIDAPNLPELKERNLMSMKGHKWLKLVFLTTLPAPEGNQSHPEGASLSVSLVLSEASVFRRLCSRGRKMKWPAAGKHHSKTSHRVWGASGLLGSHFDGPLIRRFGFLSLATLICKSLGLSGLPYGLLI